MKSREQRVVKCAFIGGATGFMFGGAVGYLVSDSRICSFVPGYFDKALQQSTVQLNKKLAHATATQAHLLSEKLNGAADTVSHLFQDGSRMNTAMHAIKFVANKIPSVTGHLPVVGSFLTKTLSFANPILSGLTYTAFDITTDIIKTGLIATCMETMSQYKIIPAACIAGTLVGASIGAMIGLAGSPQATENISDRVSMTKSFLHSQSLFSSKMKNMPQVQPQHRLQRSKSMSSL